MNESFEIIRRDDAVQKVFIMSDALSVRDMALSKSSLIGKVTSPAEQETAVAAQADLQRIRSDCEKSRKAVKEPVLAYSRLIDSTAREFCSDIDAELLRLATLIGDFQSLEQAKVREAEKLKNQELSHIERDRATELAAATSHEQMDEINEKYDQKAALLSQAPSVQPVRAAGQVVKPDWEITVTDIWLLAKSHSLCVKIEPVLSEIKNLLNAGVNVAGVKAVRITKSGVRLKQPSKVINV
jgi:beta-glucosidase-like glycosyl hydrolase